MTMDLEDSVMRDLGLWPHPSAFHNIIDCAEMRQRAVLLLESVIWSYSEQKKIAFPRGELFVTVHDISKKDAAEGVRMITRTWQAVSYLVAEAVYQNNEDEDARVAAFSKLNKYLRFSFLGEREQKDIVTPELVKQS